MSDASRRYSDREVALILRMAADLEAQPGRSVVLHTAGRTRAEIEDIAAAAGIDRIAVNAALDAWHAEAGGALSAFVGGATLLRVERQVDAELSDEDMTELIDRARWSLGSRPGEVSQQAGIVRWVQATPEGPSTEVELARRDGATRIRILNNRENTAGWSLIAAGGAGLIAGAALSGVLDPTQPLIFAIFGGSFGAAAVTVRMVWRNSVTSTKAKLLKLMEQMEANAHALGVRKSRSE